MKEEKTKCNINAKKIEKQEEDSVSHRIKRRGTSLEQTLRHSLRIEHRNENNHLSLSRETRVGQNITTKA